MITRALRQVLHLPQQNIIFPPTYLLPLRAHFSVIPSKAEPKISPPAFPPPPPPPPPSPSPAYLSKFSTRSPVLGTAHNLIEEDHSRLSKSSHSSLPNSFHPSSSLDLLPTLAAQPPHYIIVRIHQRPYLLTFGDSLRLPFNVHGAPPGTILRLTRASALGSRDYTFRGKPFIDERYFVCRVQVVGVEGEPMRVMEKTKRRQRHIKRVKSKMRYTVVRCIELKVVTGAEAEAEAKAEAEAEAEAEKENTPNEPKISKA